MFSRRRVSSRARLCYAEACTVARCPKYFKDIFERSNVDAGFIQCASDMCHYWKVDGCQLFVGGYADDLMFTRTYTAAFDRFFTRFKMSIHLQSQSSAILLGCASFGKGEFMVNDFYSRGAPDAFRPPPRWGPCQWFYQSMSDILLYSTLDA